MKTPESIIHRLFGDLRTVEILGREVDLVEAVQITPGSDLESALFENAERRALWGKVLSRCRCAVDKAHDALEDQRAVRFHQYWSTMEDREREEMVAHPLDEDVVFDQFRRRKATKQAVSQGRKGMVGRWRRNFSDDLIWSLVNSDEQIVKLRKELRTAKAQLEVAYGVRDALDARTRALSQLVAIHRDDQRR